MASIVSRSCWRYGRDQSRPHHCAPRDAGQVLTAADATRALARCSDIDYLGGRPIKCDLGRDTVDPWLYDRDMGAGAFAAVVAKLRDEK